MTCAVKIFVNNAVYVLTINKFAYLLQHNSGRYTYKTIKVLTTLPPYLQFEHMIAHWAIKT